MNGCDEAERPATNIEHNDSACTLMVWMPRVIAQSRIPQPVQPGQRLSAKIRISLNLKSGYPVGILDILRGFLKLLYRLRIGSGTWFAPCRNRTYNPVIKSHLLCQLS